MNVVPFVSPTDLLHTDVIATLGTHTDEGRKLQSCRRTSRCHSIYCPHCLKLQAHTRGRELYQSAKTLNPSRLKAGTLVAADTALDGLRDAGRIVMKAARSTLKRLKCADYALSFETSLADGDTYHPHTHLLLESAPSGRNYISNASLEDAWLSELPSWMHPQMAASEIEPVRDLGATCTYNTKSPFAGISGQAGAGRVIDSLFTLKGMKRFERRGNMKFDEWAGHPFISEMHRAA